MGPYKNPYYWVDEWVSLSPMKNGNNGSGSGSTRSHISVGVSFLSTFITNKKWQGQSAQTFRNCFQRLKNESGKHSQPNSCTWLHISASAVACVCLAFVTRKNQCLASWEVNQSKFRRTLWKKTQGKQRFPRVGGRHVLLGGSSQVSQVVNNHGDRKSPK